MKKKCGCSRCCPPPKPVCKPVCEPVCKPKCRPVCPPPACVDPCACPCDEEEECEGITIINQSSWCPALVLVNGAYPNTSVAYTNVSVVPAPTQNGYTLTYKVPASVLGGASVIKFTDATYSVLTGTNNNAGLPLFGQFDLSEGRYFRLFNVGQTLTSGLPVATTPATTNAVYLCINQTEFYYTGNNPVTDVITQSWQPSSVALAVSSYTNSSGSAVVGSDGNYPTSSAQYLSSNNVPVNNALNVTGAYALVVPENFYYNFNPSATTVLANTNPQYGGPMPLATAYPGATIPVPALPPAV